MSNDEHVTLAFYALGMMLITLFAFAEPKHD